MVLFYNMIHTEMITYNISMSWTLKYIVSFKKNHNCMSQYWFLQFMTFEYGWHQIYIMSRRMPHDFGRQFKFDEKFALL